MAHCQSLLPSLTPFPFLYSPYLSFPFPSSRLSLNSISMGGLNINNMIASPGGMFNYKFGEFRRKLVVLFGLVLLFFLTLVAFHRQDKIKQIVGAEREPLSASTLSSGLKPLPAKSLKDVRNSTLGVSIDHDVDIIPKLIIYSSKKYMPSTFRGERTNLTR